MDDQGLSSWPSTPNWDKPFDVVVSELKGGKKDQLWESRSLEEGRNFGLQKLANLGRVPKPNGFEVAALPVRIEKVSAGWVKVVAIIEEKNRYR